MKEVTDVRVGVGIATHPKTRKLIRRVGRDAAWSLICLFAFAAANRPDGRLSGMSVEDLEIAAEWEGDDGALVAALREIGYLDEVDDGVLCIHDWTEWNGYAVGAPARSEQAHRAAYVRHHGDPARKSKNQAKRSARAEVAGQAADDPLATSMPAACSVEAESMQLVDSSIAPVTCLPIFGPLET